MTEQKPEYVDVEVELEDYQLEYIKKNNIDINELARRCFDELIEKNEKDKAEEIARLKELMGKYPDVVNEWR